MRDALELDELACAAPHSEDDDDEDDRNSEDLGVSGILNVERISG